MSAAEPPDTSHGPSAGGRSRRRSGANREEARAFWGRRAPVSAAAATPAWDCFVRLFHRPTRVDPLLAYPLPPEYLELEEHDSPR